MDRVVWESRHKFVYYDYESINLLRLVQYDYPAVIETDAPIVVYILDEGLPKVDTELKLDKDVIKSFHGRYYELLIFLEIINKIADNIDNDELNKRLERLFKLCARIGREEEIDGIKTLRNLLIESKNMYKDAYIEYMETGKLDFYDKVPIPFIMMDNLLEMLKKNIGLKKYFSILLDLGTDSSIYTCMAINSYIASRCNGYLSMNVLVDKYDKWKYYYASNGQFIQNVHDYTEVDYTTNKKRIRQKEEE